jgi:hypothetical protein
MGRTATCATAALAAVLAGGALGLASDVRAVDGGYDYVAVAFGLLSAALVVGGVVLVLVALADRVLGRLPEEAAPASASPVAVPASTPVRTSDTTFASSPSSLSAARTAARTAAHRHALSARRAAGAATRRAGQHASTAQRVATTSLAAAVSRSVEAVRSTAGGASAAGAAVPGSASAADAPDTSTAPVPVADRAVPAGAAASPMGSPGPGVPPHRP